MKRRLPLLVLPFALVAAINCGARTQLDEPPGTAAIDSGGGGQASKGGSGGHWSTGGSSGKGGSISGLGGVPGASSGGNAGSVGGRGGQTGPGPATGGIRSSGGNFAGGTTGGAGRDGGLDARSDGPPVDAFGKGGAAGFATGGTPGAGGAVGPDAGVCPSSPTSQEMIDDLNDGDRFIPAINGRVGAWSASHDNSPNASMSPDPNGSFAPTYTGDICRKYAMHVTGSGYVLWGAQFSVGLGSPYNASKYTGITFFAKADPGTSSVVRVNFPDKDTHPDGNLCSTNPNAGANACFDHYQYRITLSSTWTQYTIPFNQLEHGNWGRGGSGGFDPSTLYEILFQIPVGATFGIWVDDIAFTY